MFITLIKKMIKDNNGTVRVNNFSYEGYAARLLTYQEVVSACGTGTATSTGYMDNCKYLTENTYHYSASGLYGYWLENTSSAASTYAWFTGVSAQTGFHQLCGLYWADNSQRYGVRPAIEVPLSKIQK